jgi:hypothetical protein
MFGIKKTEFTKNYKTLFKGRLNPSTFSVFGYKIGDSANLIDLRMIETTLNHEYPENVTPWPHIEGRVFYLTTDDEIVEYHLKDRIENVMKSDGLLEMKAGYFIRIENGTIVGFILNKILPIEITDMPESQIQEKFGKASEIRKDYAYLDIEDEEDETEDIDINSEYFYTLYYYAETKLTVTFVNWLQKIYSVKIGEPFLKNKIMLTRCIENIAVQRFGESRVTY